MASNTFGHIYPWQILTRAAGARLTCLLQSNLDPSALRLECEAIMQAFKPVGQHGDDHAGGWKALSLVASGGDVYESRVLPDQPAEKTPALAFAPYLESIIDGFACDVQRVRLMQLLPGETILWHVDPTESLDSLNARIHIPIVTSSAVQFQLSHEDCRWRSGEMWYGDFTFPHRVRNDGNDGRLHLVMDVEVNEHVRDLFPEEYRNNQPRREAVRGIVERMVKLYTTPRYRFGYMKRKQESDTYKTG